MISASELGRPELALHWHEAVAVVSETAAMLLDRGITNVPDLASIILLPDGTLHFVQEGPPSSAPAQPLGSMLDELLSSTACPAELRQLTAGSMADPPAYATVGEFAEALAFFERPGRQELLMAVAARASEAALEARAHTELERLEARTRNVPSKTEPRPDKTPSHKHHPAVYVVAGVLLLLGVVGGAFAALRATGSSPGALTERVRARVDRIATKGLEAVGLRTPTAPATAPDAAVTTTPRVTPKPSRRAPRKLPETISVKELTGGTASSLPSATAPESSEPHVRDEAVYTSGAEGVEPAVLIRPHLPSRPPSDTPSEQIGILDIVVSATGAVEQVRLISTSNRYQDRMIVAAAKAWQFEPAMKDGQPVRYRTQIRITL
jgi:TonB family protein